MGGREGGGGAALVGAKPPERKNTNLKALEIK